MPDKYRFDHLPWMGNIEHRCIDCGWPEEPKRLSEKERQSHYEKHQREYRKDVERRQAEALRKARRTKAQIQRENALIEERSR